MFEIFSKFLLTFDDCREFLLDLKKLKWSHFFCSISKWINICIFIYYIQLVIVSIHNHAYLMIFLCREFLFWCISNHISIDTDCHFHRRLTDGQFFGVANAFLAWLAAKHEASRLSENFITLQTVQLHISLVQKYTGDIFLVKAFCLKDIAAKHNIQYSARFKNEFFQFH